MPSPQLAVWMDETNGGKIDVVAVDTDGVPGRHRRHGFPEKKPCTEVRSVKPVQICSIARVVAAKISQLPRDHNLTWTLHLLLLALLAAIARFQTPWVAP